VFTRERHRLVVAAQRVPQRALPTADAGGDAVAEQLLDTVVLEAATRAVERSARAVPLEPARNDRMRAQRGADRGDPAVADAVVVVAERDRVRARVRDSDVARVAEAELVARADHAEARVALHELVGDARGVVGRAVVDDEHLEWVFPRLRGE